MHINSVQSRFPKLHESHKMQTFITFPNEQAAREYRYAHGTGGWIFTHEQLTVLFPPDMPPGHIFRHQLTKGQSGRLIGCA